MTDDNVLWTIESGTSAQTIAKMIRVLFPDARTVLDMTYGSGQFWRDGVPEHLKLTAMDADPKRGRDVVGDFTSLQWPDGTFDLAIFDPPYHTDRGRGKSSVMAERFGHYPTLDDLRTAVEAGCNEGYRVSKLGIIVKCQDYIHASQYVEMTEWIRAALGKTPYQRVDQLRAGKIIDPKWNPDEQLSAWSNSSTFLAFRHGRQEHKRRKHGPERTPSKTHTWTPVQTSVQPVASVSEAIEIAGQKATYDEIMAGKFDVPSEIVDAAVELREIKDGRRRVMGIKR